MRPGSGWAAPGAGVEKPALRTEAKSVEARAQGAAADVSCLSRAGTAAPSGSRGIDGYKPSSLENSLEKLP